MSIFETIFPNHTCLACGREINKSEHKFICDVCAEKLPQHEKICDMCGCEISMHAFVCDRCKSTDGKDKWHFLRARSAFCYQSPIDELILRLKYNAEGDVAKFAALWIAETIAKYAINADIIIPVPLAPKRAKQRGYNQASLIAAELSKILGIPVADNVLVRIKHTEAQKKMTPKERQENLKGAFEINPPFASVKGKRVLIVDDVFTTGATVNECARILKRAKPKSIEVITIASVSQQAKKSVVK